MKRVRDMDDGTSLVRPLLSWASRSDTEEFCVWNGIEYRTDPMNHDDKFSRVRIRKTILPLLAEINPKIVQTLARTADLMGRNTDSPESDWSPEHREDLALKDLKALERPALYAALRSWLRTRRGNLRSLQLKHIEAIENLITSRKSGTTVELPGGGSVVKQRGALTFRNIKVDK
jgi:tRNA(Ile)-lysidine synthase